jgi:phosphatidylethanolamine-binding protein (PEBP) family uncharacterized protein
VPGSLKVQIQTGAQASSTPSPLFRKEDTDAQPTVSWIRNRPKDLYTLICIDPDAPGAASPWLHWLVINCSGTTVSSGNEIVSWAPPTPPPGSGIHRYIFQLYRQSGSTPLQPQTFPVERAAFPLEKTVAENNLTLVDSKEYRVAAD